MDRNQLKQLNKLSAKSYNDQKALIKRILMGKPAKCPTCQQNLQFLETQDSKGATIRCRQGCTDIELDIS
ncbi:hypothetical protein FE810_04580 [Thalassotalea litorea]|uniref:Uncharacterized protein n=1 Tax=Thalassotalea litorea TaxID=2020715 RepID=A0A5R9IXY1_9GAMM|nr:hypothetical protein [Thalassotalea litorea]TLU66788.1 hypothetical protein FE810_04580 [Thalassotalea litorea]